MGTSVLQVSAHDKDLGLNGQVCNSPFWIEAPTSAQFQFVMSHSELVAMGFAIMFTHEYIHLKKSCRYNMLYPEFAYRDAPAVNKVVKDLKSVNSNVGFQICTSYLHGEFSE